MREKDIKVEKVSIRRLGEMMTEEEARQREKKRNWCR